MGMLTTLQVADSLGTDGLHIDRAIAIGALPASRVGTAGPVRIDEAAVVDWGRKGYPKFDLPEQIRSNWYDDIERGVRMESDAFAGAMADALKDWADPQPEPASNVSSVQVKPTQAMRAIAAAAVQPSIFRPKSKKAAPAPYANRLENAMILATRSAAYSTCQRMTTGGAPLQKLFRSREDFQRISTEAARSALERTVNYRRTWPGPIGGFSQPHDVRYSVRLGDLIAGSESAYIAKLIDLAF